MALPDTVKHEAASSRTSGISAQAVTTGANFLGSEIDNSVNKDLFLDFEFVFTSSVSPAAGKSVEVYLIYAVDGTNYDDGAVGTDPLGNPIAMISLPEDTSAHQTSRHQIQLTPYKFKILVKSESDQTVTITIDARTHNVEVVD